MIDMLKKLLSITLILLFTFPFVASTSWTGSADLYPAKGTPSKNAVVVATIQDSEGDIVKPSVCDSITVDMSYPGDSNTQLFSYITDSGEEWQNEFTMEESDYDFRVGATGNCSGEEGTIDYEDKPWIQMDLGNITVDIKNDFSQRIEEGIALDLKADVTYEGNALDTADVSYKFLNPYKNTEDSGTMSHSSGSTFSSQVDIPEKVGKFVISVSATNGSEVGGEAFLVDTKRTLEGDASMSYTGDKCDIEEYTKCEPGAQLTFNYTETVNDAKNVSVELIGNSVIDKVYLQNVSDSLWQGNLSIPTSFDTSEYGNEFGVKVKANRDDLWDNQTFPLSINPFEVNVFKSKSVFNPGESGKFTVEVIRPYSGSYLTLDQVSIIDSNIRDAPDGENLDSFSKENFSSDSVNEPFYMEYTVPESSETDVTRYFTAQVTDQYGRTGPLSFGYTDYDVKESTLSSGFLEVNVSEVNRTLQGEGIKPEYLKFENTVDQDLFVRVDRTEGNISDILVGDDSQKNYFDGDRYFFIQNKSSKVKFLEFNVSEDQYYESYTGILRLVASNSTGDSDGTVESNLLEIPFDIKVRLMALKSGDLAVQKASIDKVINDSEDDTSHLLIKNMGSEKMNVSLSLNGTIEDIADLDDEFLKLNSSENKTVEIDYETSPKIGEYTGDITINNSDSTLEVPINVTLDILPLGNGTLGVNRNNITETITSEGVTEDSIDIYNLREEKGNVSAELEGKITEIASLDSKEIEINGSDSSSLGMSYDIGAGDIGYYEGNLSLNNTNYTLKVPFGIVVDLEALARTDGPLGTNLSNIESTQTSGGTFRADIDVFNSEDSGFNVEASMEGNISDIVDRIEPQSRYIEGNSRSVFYMYYTAEPDYNGTYTGKIKFSTDDRSIEIPVTINLEVPLAGEFTASTKGDSDIGTYVRGEDVSFLLEIENTGSTELSEFELSPDIAGVENNLSESYTLPPGETVAVELSFSTSGKSYGPYTNRIIDITASPSASDSASFSFEIIENYNDKFEDLQNELMELRARLENNITGFEENKTRVENDIEEIESKISQGMDSWDNRNYQEAKSIFEEAQSRKSSAESKVEELSFAEPPSSGFPVLFIGLIAAFIAIGIILFLSIEPE